MSSDPKPEDDIEAPKTMTTREMHRALDTHSLKPFDIAESVRFCQAVDDLAEYVQLIPLPFDPFAVGLCYLESSETEYRFVIANGRAVSNAPDDESEGVKIMVGLDAGRIWTSGPPASCLIDALATIVRLAATQPLLPGNPVSSLVDRLLAAAEKLDDDDLERYIIQIEAVAAARCKSRD